MTAFTLINGNYSSRNQGTEAGSRGGDPRLRPIWHGYFNALAIEHAARNLLWQAVIGQQMENPVWLRWLSLQKASDSLFIRG
jgi:hypothetical protein